MKRCLSSMGIMGASLATLLGFGCDMPPVREDPVTAYVCVLNSQELPENEQKINDAINFAGNAFRKYANIDLKFSKIQSYKGDLSNLIFENKTFLSPHGSCELPHDLALVFTSANNIISVRSGESKGNYTNGNAWSNRSYAIIYGKHPWEAEDVRDRTTVHEMGHLFGLLHSLDFSDVMNRFGGSSSNNYNSFSILRDRRVEDLAYYLDRQFPDSVFVQPAENNK